MSSEPTRIEVQFTEPVYGAAMGTGVLRTHAPDQCSGEFCSIHNQSDHPLRDAPYNWRSDRGMMERICTHGVGHPDPDDVAHHHRVAPQDDDWYSVHGCDGCCQVVGVL